MSDNEKNGAWPHTVEAMTLAGCTSRTGIRYWEDAGLLGNVHRTPGGTRRYTNLQLKQARIIATAQFGGFDLKTIKQMLEEYFVDGSVFEALQLRLEDQMRAAVRLSEHLPNPADEKPVLEYDL